MKIKVEDTQARRRKEYARMPRVRLVAQDGYVLEQHMKLWFLKDPKGNLVAGALGVERAMIVSFLRHDGAKLYVYKKLHWRRTIVAQDGSMLRQTQRTRLWYIYDPTGECVAGALSRAAAMRVAFHRFWRR